MGETRMSADDWQDCPICKAKDKEILEYIYGKVPAEIYELAKDIYNHHGDSDGLDLTDEINDALDIFKTDDKVLDDYVDKLGYTIETGTPVEIRTSYSLGADGTCSFDFSATCTRCGHEFTEENK